MKIALIDNNLNFTNKILKNLNTNGYETEHYTSVDLAMRDSKSDMYLLATSFAQKECTNFIEYFKHKIIILIADTYTYPTVREPLNLGAKDYVVKPFRMEELECKIGYFKTKISMNDFPVDIKSNHDIQVDDDNHIMTIEEYIQFIIKKYQYKITDTELAKRLNISRKTLYDRRNKYQLYKNKKGRMVS